MLDWLRQEQFLETAKRNRKQIARHMLNPEAACEFEIFKPGRKPAQAHLEILNRQMLRDTGARWHQRPSTYELLLPG